MSALPHRAPPRPTSAVRAPAASPRPAPRPAARRAPARPRRARVATLVAVVVVGVLAVVGVQAQAAEVAFEARALEHEIADLERRHEQLTAEVAALESPERLRTVALGELGMVLPEQPTYLDLSAPGRLAAEERPEPVDPVKEASTRP